MAQHDLEITIDKTGEVRVHIKGVKGKACTVYGKLLAEIVGQLKSQQLTSEYYEPDQKARMEVRQEEERA